MAAHGLMAVLEELDGALVLRGFLTRVKRAQVSALASLRINLSRIESILAGLEFANHRVSSEYNSRRSTTPLLT